MSRRRSLLPGFSWFHLYTQTLRTKSFDYRCPERATSYRHNGFVKCREDSSFSDSRRNPMSIHVGSKIWADTPEDDADPLASQIIK